MSAPFQLFDALDPAIEAALRASIDRWGVIVPVVIDQHGRMIDGHHRRRIAEMLGVECPTHVREVANAGEARDLALTLNADRRQLDPDHRREMVAHLRHEGFSERDIAGALGTSQPTVHRDLARSGDSHESPETVRGRDGKSYPATRPAPEPEPDDEAEPLFAPGEHDAILDELREAHGDDLTPEDIERAVDENVESKRTPDVPRPEVASRDQWQPSKPDLGDGVSHPARYSAELIALFRTLLAEYGIPGDSILDPFAGTGKVHELQVDGWETVGVEIEPEWAGLHPDTRVGSALDLPFDQDSFGAIVTSPTYGNRFADSHDATDPERRRSYTHDLGRKLDFDNSGDLHWRTTAPGDEGHGSGDYRCFHESAWAEAVRVLIPGGLFILNCCDHVRDGLSQPVTAWHCWALGRLGLVYVESRSVDTRKLRQGANGNLREQEQVHVFRLPSFTGAESR